MFSGENIHHLSEDAITSECFLALTPLRRSKHPGCRTDSSDSTRCRIGDTNFAIRPAISRNSLCSSPALADPQVATNSIRCVPSYKIRRWLLAKSRPGKCRVLEAQRKWRTECAFRGGLPGCQYLGSKREQEAEYGCIGVDLWWWIRLWDCKSYIFYLLNVIFNETERNTCFQRHKYGS